MSEAFGTNGPPDLEPLDAYLDGLMGEHERKAFEESMARDPAIRAEIDRQRRLDKMLAARFATPDEATVQRLVDGVTAPRRTVIPARPQWVAVGRGLAIAASVAVLCFGLWRIAASMRNGPAMMTRGTALPDYNPRVALDALYQRTVAAGFKPRWVCDNEREFIETFARQLRQGLRFVPTDTVAMVGLDYAATLTELAVTFLGRAHGENVIVTVDRASFDTGLSVPPDSGLHVFKRVLGPLVLYEVTPLDKPWLLDRFELADVPGG